MDSTVPTPISASQSAAPVTIPALFIAWFVIGLQSFGGGQSTLSLIQRNLGAQRRWITNDDFVRANAMAIMAPGINLIAITILIGAQLAGTVGIFASVAGLLLPSVAVTILMTAGYAQISRLPAVIHAFHAIVPATVGIGSITAITMFVALAKPRGITHKSAEWAASIVLALVSYLLMMANAPVIAVILGGGVVFALLHHFLSKRQQAPQAEEETR